MKDSAPDYSENIFDYYDRLHNNCENFDWKNGSHIQIFEEEKLCDGILYEFENTHEKSKLYRFIAFFDKILRFNIIDSIPDKSSYQKNEGCLNLFFPTLTIVKDKKEGICGLSLTSHQKSRTFFSKNRNEIKKWYLALSNCCILTSIKKNYTILNIIGNGNFSKVSLAVKNQDGSQYAIKTIYLDKINYKLKHIEAIINEIKISKMLDNPNITKLYEVYFSNSSINLVFEYLKGGELFEYLDTKLSFSEEEARNIIQKLVSIVKYIHSKGVIHRDLKPENILLEDREDLLSFKIADFGLSIKSAKNELQYVRCGSPGFVAPESLNKQGYNQKADIFSIGVIAFILLTGSPPFQGETFKETLIANKICNINFDCEELKLVSPQAFKFIKDTLERDPVMRITAEEAEKHIWFQSKCELSKKNSKIHKKNPPNLIQMYSLFSEETADSKHPKTFESPLLVSNSHPVNQGTATPELKPCKEKLMEVQLNTSAFRDITIIDPIDFEEMKEIPEEYDNTKDTYESVNNICCPEKKISAYLISQAKKLSDK